MTYSPFPDPALNVSTTAMSPHGGDFISSSWAMGTHLNHLQIIAQWERDTGGYSPDIRGSGGKVRCENKCVSWRMNLGKIIKMLLFSNIPGLIATERSRHCCPTSFYSFTLSSWWRSLHAANPHADRQERAVTFSEFACFGYARGNSGVKSETLSLWDGPESKDVCPTLDQLCSIARTHVVEGEKQLLQVFPWPAHLIYRVPVAFTHTKQTNIIFKTSNGRLWGIREEGCKITEDISDVLWTQFPFMFFK